MKVVRLNSSAAKGYGKGKALEENKKSLSSPAATSALRYKTELCRPFLDNGFCKYGDKCQFAHGDQDLRNLPRHPKYKTELCRTFHTRGYCPYGSRCHFIHSMDETRKNQLDSTASGNGGAAGSIKSPTLIPLSPALDSGISSPEDYQQENFFNFQGNDHCNGSGSDGVFGDTEPSLEHDNCFLPSCNACGQDIQPYSASAPEIQPYIASAPDIQPYKASGRDIPPYNPPGQEIAKSPDSFMEFDMFPMGRELPTKPMPLATTGKTEDYSSELCNVRDLLSNMSLEKPRSALSSVTSPSSCHRLPVFSDILSTAVDDMLDLNGETEVKSPSKLLKFFTNTA